jgi:hypothetical protein
VQGNLKGLFIRSRLQSLVHFHPSDPVLILSAHKVDLGEIDHFVATPAQHSANHVEAKAKGLF